MQLIEALDDLREELIGNPGASIEAKAQEIAPYYGVAPSLLARKFRDNWPDFDPVLAKITDRLHSLDWLREEQVRKLMKRTGTAREGIVDASTKVRNGDRYLVQRKYMGERVKASAIKWDDAQLVVMDMTRFRRPR